MSRKTGAVALVLFAALAVAGAWLALWPGEGESAVVRPMFDPPPLAALMNFWFGFNLTTGEGEGGIGSSHWNTDYGTHNSRVGVTDEPEYGYYTSDDPAVIAQQLRDMEQAGINTIFASWHGNGDTNLDGSVDLPSYEGEPNKDDAEKMAMHRAIKVTLGYIRDNNLPFKVAILVEPYMANGKTAESLTLADKNHILDLLWNEFYEPYSDLMFE